MSYRGKELLRIMKKAQNYNTFVANTIITSMADKNKKVLDFGAGYGFFAELLRKKGVSRITCIEIDEELNEHCKNLDFIVFNDLNALEPKSFDFIYSLNVLEHIEEDEKTLSLLKDKLNENGKILIYVPAFQCLYSSFDKQIGHYRRYEKKTFTLMLEAVGFDVQSAKYIDSVGFMLAFLYKLINKKDGQISSIQIEFFDKLLFPISRIIDILTRGSLFGKNLIVEARLKK